MEEVIITEIRKKDRTEHKGDGFVQFAGLEKGAGGSMKEKKEDLICPESQDNVNAPAYYEDLSTFLRGAPDKEKVAFFRRCAGATDPKKRQENKTEVYFHIGCARSQPYLHAHIAYPDRSYQN